MPSYVPGRGDLIWLNFDPQVGHEQAGRRPAFVVSPIEYNRKVGLAVCCPITSEAKGYPFEVALAKNIKVQGAVLSDQVNSLDWRVRKARFIERLPDALTQEVIAKILAIIR